MPFVKIFTPGAAHVDLKAVHETVMAIFGVPGGAVQVVLLDGTRMYPQTALVDMRAKAKPERDAAWMEAALLRTASAAADAGVPGPVRVRCELFDDKTLHKL